MITYYTKLLVKNDFNEDTLLELFYNYLSTPLVREKYPNKNYFTTLTTKPVSFPYLLIEDDKQLEIINKYGLAIRYTYFEKSIQTRFIVEASLQHHMLILSLDKVELDPSYHFSSVGIPRVFKEIIQDKYIQKDHDLSMKDIVQHGNDEYYNKISKASYHYPLVILRKQKQCIYDPYRFASELLGIAHIIVIKNQTELLDQFEVIYPDETGKLYTSKQEVYEEILKYHLIFK